MQDPFHFIAGQSFIVGWEGGGCPPTAARLLLLGKERGELGAGKGGTALAALALKRH